MLKFLLQALSMLLLVDVHTTVAAEDSAALMMVADFYKKYLNYSYHDNPNVPAPKMTFSTSFAKAIEDNREVCARYSSGVCGWGAEGDEYLDAQEIDPELTFDNSDIEFKEIEKNLIQVSLNVYPSDNVHKKYYTKIITHKLIQENGVWVVDDIVYTGQGSSRKLLMEEREYYIANPDPDSVVGKLKEESLRPIIVPD